MGLDYLTTLRTRGCIKSEVAELRHWSHVLGDVVSDVWFYTDELTFLPNRKAYDSRERLPVQVWIDVKDLYRINEQFGERVGDEVLWRVARTLEATGVTTFRLFADKFALECNTSWRAQLILTQLRTSLLLERIPVPPAPSRLPTWLEISCWCGIGGTLLEAEHVATGAKRRRSFK
jgi:hypothetical protein